MPKNRNSIALLTVIALTVAALSLAACVASPGVLDVSSGDGGLKVFADHVTKSATESMSVGSADKIEVEPDVKSGEISVTLSDGNGTAYGSYTFNSTDKKHKLFDVEQGNLKVQIDAKNASGRLLIREVVVLDGPGTAGS